MAWAGMNTMRWNAGLLAAAVCMAGLAGCRQQCFMTEAEYQSCRNSPALLPSDLECNPHDAIVPAVGNTPPPATVLDTDRPVRYMSLQEAIAIALEQGNVGSQSPLFPGITNEGLVAFNGRFVAGSDSIRVLSLDPAITYSDIESALARFDARWLTSMTWQKNDQALTSTLTSLQNGDTASFSSGVYKPLPTGGLAGITYNMNYQFFTNPPTQFAVVNPSFRPQLQFLFEQPLLQFYGVEINQLSSAQPGSFLVPGLRPAGGQRTEGIVITRLRFDQQRTEFERNVHYLLYNVEVAYWNLYGAYYTLYSREQGVRQALVAWQVNRQRFEVGRIAIQDLAQTRAQYELFRAQRYTALSQVLENERQLRGLLGMPAEDGQRIVPSDAPILSALRPDWPSAENDTLAYRPELILARQDLKFRQLDLIVQKNLLKPDLRFTSTYDINGIGTRLDGTSPPEGSSNGNALGSFTSNRFNNWTLGLRMDVPLGFRDAHAAVRTARLNLQRSYLQLKDTEEKSRRFLALQYRNVFRYYEEIVAQRAQREANAIQLDARFQLYRAGKETIPFLLEAQRNFVDALASEYTAIVNYNNAIVGLEFAKGTIMRYDNVTISEGPLPACVQVRAVEHIRERDIALKLRERPDPAVYQALNNCTTCGAVAHDTPPSLAQVQVLTPVPPPPQMPAGAPANLPNVPGAAPAAPGIVPMPTEGSLPEGR